MLLVTYTHNGIAHVDRKTYSFAHSKFVCHVIAMHNDTDFKHFLFAIDIGENRSYAGYMKMLFPPHSSMLLPKTHIAMQQKHALQMHVQQSNSNKLQII